MAGVSARLRSTAALPRRIGKRRSVECRPPTALRHSTAEPGSMAHPQVIAERHSTWGPPPRTAVARMAAARLAARWEVARMAAVVHMAAGHPTLRWGHPMAAVRPMAVAGPMAAAARMAEGQAATTAEATSALSYLGRLSSRRRRCAKRKQAFPAERRCSAGGECSGLVRSAASLSASSESRAVSDHTDSPHLGWQGLTGLTSMSAISTQGCSRVWLEPACQGSSCSRALRTFDRGGIAILLRAASHSCFDRQNGTSAPFPHL